MGRCFGGALASATLAGPFACTLISGPRWAPGMIGPDGPANYLQPAAMEVKPQCLIIPDQEILAHPQSEVSCEACFHGAPLVSMTPTRPRASQHDLEIWRPLKNELIAFRKPAEDSVAFHSRVLARAACLVIVNTVCSISNIKALGERSVLQICSPESK
jgi:hypothetical protein